MIFDFLHCKRPPRLVEKAPAREPSQVRSFLPGLNAASPARGLLPGSQGGSQSVICMPFIERLREVKLPGTAALPLRGVISKWVSESSANNPAEYAEPFRTGTARLSVLFCALACRAQPHMSGAPSRLPRRSAVGGAGGTALEP